MIDFILFQIALAAEDLKCRDVQKAFAAVSVLSKITPSFYSLFLIGCLLIENNADLKNIACKYITFKVKKKNCRSLVQVG